MWTLMSAIELPPELRVGQGYGKVSWAVRTFWEEYVGWFKLQSTTEFYPDSAPAALAELLVLTGTDAALDRAEAALERGDAVLAIKLGEAVAVMQPDDERLRALMAAAHRFLLEHGGDVSFWENGWLRTELTRWSEGT
jgi:alkyl sulfatase BDS1-like metallo-beta-lactamase superfamily hydrolase